MLNLRINNYCCKNNWKGVPENRNNKNKIKLINITGSFRPLHNLKVGKFYSTPNDVAFNELSTDSYTQVDLGLDWTPSAFNGLKVSAVIRNLTDEEIRRHTSAIKDLLPESGRDIRLSIGLSF